MFREQVLAPLEAVTRLLMDANPQTLEQTEIHLEAAVQQLQAYLSERSLSSDELKAVNRQCRRIARLLASAQEFYGGLTNIISIQTMGYGPAASKSRLGTGSRFVIEA
jgi:hypothetical protein